MLYWLIVVSIIGETLLLSWVDEKTFGTRITPFTLLAWPFLAMVLLYSIIGQPLGFVSLSLEALLWWQAYLLLFWIGGITIYLILGRGVNYAHVQKNREVVAYSTRIPLLMLWLVIPIISFFLFKSIVGVGGLSNISSYEFQRLYGGGLPGHLRVFSYLPFIVLMGHFKKENYFETVTLLVMIVLYFAYPVQSWLILPIIAGIIYRALSGKIKINLRTLVLIAIVMFVIFILFYTWEFYTRNQGNYFSINIFIELAIHFCAYLFGGILAFSQLLSNTLGSYYSEFAVLIAPIINLYNSLAGLELNNICTSEQMINFVHAKGSNVYTLFGTIYCFTGASATIVFAWFLGIVSYGLLVIAMRAKNPWLLAYTTFFCSALVVAWFDYYYWMLPFWELFVWALGLTLILWFRNHVRISSRFGKHRIDIKEKTI